MDLFSQFVRVPRRIQKAQHAEDEKNDKRRRKKP